MGVALHDGAVHESTGVSLVAVAHHIFLRGGLFAGALPLSPRGESAAATAPEAGIRDVLADLLAGHLEKRLFKGGVAPLGDILLDVLGIAAAAVFQHHPVLLFIEWDIRLPGIGHPVQVVDQAVDDLSAQHGPLQDLVAVLRGDMDIHDPHGLDMDQRTHLAKAVAAAHLHMEALFLIRVMLEPHVDGKPPPLTLGLDILVDLHGAAGNAAGAGADQHRGYLLALLEGVAGVGLKHMKALPGQFGLHHPACASFPRISSSRASAVSGVIFA